MVQNRYKIPRYLFYATPIDDIRRNAIGNWGRDGLKDKNLIILICFANVQYIYI